MKVFASTRRTKPSGWPASMTRWWDWKTYLCRWPALAEVDLVLSGHTHGGQVTLRPEKNLSGRPRRRMLRGLGRRANTQIYVTRGLGTVVLPIRYGCPPEVSVLELRSMP